MRETIRHQGVVERVEATTCVVRIIQQTACGGCAARQLCKISDGKRKTVEASVGSEPVRVGQTVVVEGSLAQGYRAVWIAYAVPLVLMVAVLFLGCTLWGEGVGALAALGVLALYYGTLYLFRVCLDRRFRFSVRPLDGETVGPENVRKVSPGQASK
ncbi:MAG TPA: Fis family transcriptional regulator [Prevotellaceae bacterium]|nr:Fis family transcriptional regulator [Prevotellaceae bacterium]